MDWGFFWSDYNCLVTTIFISDQVLITDCLDQRRIETHFVIELALGLGLGLDSGMGFGFGVTVGAQ